jgi:hypothetical protein
MPIQTDNSELMVSTPAESILDTDPSASAGERRTALARGDVHCAVCRRSESEAPPGTLIWASTNPAICTACVIEAVERVQLHPAISMRVLTLSGGIHSVRCDGDGVPDMTREHDASCDGYLYPDDMYVEARYALSGTLAENPDIAVVMRYTFGCFAKLHILPTIPTPDAVRPGVDGHDE